MNAPTRSRRARLLAIAVTALALAWAFAPIGRTPPLYDGLGFPDQPYRFVQAPAGYQHTPAPSAASYDIAIKSGGSSTYDVASTELGPQVEVFVNQTSLELPAGSTVARIRATPIATTTQPSDGEVWGNVYRLTDDTDRGTGRIHAGGQLDSIRLRAPTGPPPVPAIEFNDGSGWRRLSTTKIGNDIYSAPLAGVGDYAVIAPPGQARVSTRAVVHGRGGFRGCPWRTSPAHGRLGHQGCVSAVGQLRPPLLTILAVALLALVAVIAYVRFGRRGIRRKNRPDAPGSARAGGSAGGSLGCWARHRSRRPGGR